MLRSSLFAAASVLALSVAAVNPAIARLTDPEAQRSYESAQAAFAEGQLRDASIHLRNALQRDPDSHEARALFGRVLLRQGDADGAARELQRAARVQRSDAVDIALGEALLRLGRREEALAALDHPAETPAAAAAKNRLRGSAMMALGRYDDADAAFQAVLRHDPAAVDALLGRVRATAARGDIREADRRLDALLADHPQTAAAWSLKGELQMARGFPAAAAASLTRAIEVNPRTPGFYAARARAYLAADDVARARADAEAVKSLSPDSPLGGYLLAAIAYSQGDMETANRHYAGIRSAFSAFPPAVVLGALIKFNRDEYVQADQLLTQYVRLSPGRGEPLRALGGLRMRMGQPRRAVDALEQAVRLDQTDAAAWALLAEAYVAVENFDAAAAAYRQVATLGDPADARRAAGALALIEGDGAALAAAFGAEDGGAARGTAGAEDGRAAAQTLALLASGRYDAAAEAAARLMAAYPENPTFLNLAASAEIGRGDADAARWLLTQALRLEPGFIPALDQLDQLDARNGRSEDIEPRLAALRSQNANLDGLTVRHARLMIAQGRRDEAARILTDAAAATPDSALVAETLIRARRLIGDRRGAVTEAARLAAMPGAKAAAVTFAATTLADLGALTQAAVAARRLAEDLASDSPRAHALLGDVLSAAGDARAARRVLDAAARRWPENRVLARARVDAAVAAGNRRRALQAAAAIQPHDAVAAARLRAAALVRLDDSTGAERALSEALTRLDDPELVVDLFSLRLRAGRAETAVAEMRTWIEAHPNDRRALTAFGSALMDLGDYPGAADAYRRLLAQDSNNPIALNNYAWALHEQNRPEALDYAAQAYRIAGGSPPEIADTYGWLLVQNGRISQGLDILRAAAAGAPSNGEILYHLAYALEQTGRAADARAIVDRALRQGGDFAARADAEAMRSRLR